MKILENLSVNKGEQRLLVNINLELLPGDRLAIVGASGAGKSTLLKALAGILDDEFSISGSISRPVPRFGMVFQDPQSCLNPLRTVRNSFKLLEKLPSNKAIRMSREKIADILSRVNLRAEKKLLSSYPQQLSGGMAQRIMVALILASGYDWILADEVSSSLDMEHERSLLMLLTEQARTLVLVTHRIYLLRQFCNKVLALEEGRQVFTGTVADFFSSRIPGIRKLLENSLQDAK